MSRVPMGSNRAIHGEAFGALVSDRFEITSQGEAAERISDIWSISREDHDAFALESHRRAAVATDAGYFTAEIATVDIARLAEPGSEITVATLAQDETIRQIGRAHVHTPVNNAHLVCTLILENNKH